MTYLIICICLQRNVTLAMAHTRHTRMMVQLNSAIRLNTNHATLNVKAYRALEVYILFLCTS